MSKLLIGALIAAAAFYFLGSSGGVMRHSGNGFGTGGAGIGGYAKSSHGAVKGIGTAASGILK
ncbi:hypothetical protein [Tropicimonas aquimaris]|uniref:Uncharacterized protein n=1 Tax=Tropicimonas aquimaris TaxID=914152 RepID=A0ABW3ITM8_9RHOB